MSKQIVQPNGTEFNIGPYTSTPDVGSSLNIHLNVDGGLFDPIDRDESTYITSAGPTSKFRFRLDNFNSPDSGKTWTNFRLVKMHRKENGADDPGTIAMALIVDDIIQTVVSSTISNNGPTFAAAQTSWFQFRSFDYTQLQLDRTEIEFSWIPPFGFFQGDVEFSAVYVEIQDAYVEVATGGTKAGGSAFIDNLTFLEIGDGGAVVGLSSEVGGIQSVEGTGGATVGGRFTTVYDEVGISGLLAGGVHFPQFTYNVIVGFGGVIVSPNVDFEFTGVGGVDITGVAVGRASYNYNIANEDNDLQIGGSGVPAVGLTLPTSGEVFVSGVSGLKADYKYNASGGINIDGISGLAISRVNQKDFIFSVRTRQAITSPFLFNWNTGSIPINFYRVISRCEPEDPEKCSPISDPEDLCNRKSVVTLTGPTPAAVCTQLTKRGFRFPIDQFDQFTRPGEPSQLAAGLASGEFNDCNTLVPIEFCTIPECLEFCIDFDLLLLVKPIFEFDFTQVKEHTGDGTIFIGSCAEVILVINNDIFNEVGSGGIIVAGISEVITPINRYVATGGISVEGTIGGDDLKSTSYQYTSGLCPEEFPPTFFSAVSQKGIGSVWSDDNRIFASDDIKTNVQVSSAVLFGISTKQLIALNLGLNISDDKIIEGISVVIEKDGGTSVVAFDEEIILVGPNGIESENKATSDLWESGDNFVSYGAANDTWGIDWTPEEINSPEFGLSIKVTSTSEVPQNVFIDSITASVAVCGGGILGPRIGGSAIQRASSYVVEGTGGIAITGGLTGLAEYAYEAVGGLSIAGSYAQSLVSGVVGTPDTEQMEIGGGLTPTDFKSSVYDYSTYGGTTGGTIVSSEFATLNVVSSGWTYAGTDGVSISGTAGLKVGYAYGGDDTPILIAGAHGQNFVYTGNGTIRVGPEFEQAVTPIFSKLAFDYDTAGGVLISDSGAFIRFADLGTFEVDVKSNFVLSEINAVFGAVDVGTTLVPVDTILTACGSGCLDLPLVIDMNHNLVQSNKLSQFLFRNNFIMDSVIALHYNKPNDCWQANLHFNGTGNSGNLEAWNIVFEFACSSFVSGVELGQPMLRFGVSIVQKDLVTGVDFDTRVLSIFDPLSVCQKDAELIFKLTIDSKLVTTIVLPESTVQDTIVHDNIGLFKTGFWFENPDILFNISEVGTELPTRRINVTPFVNY